MSQEGCIDPGEGTSGLETDAGAVNRAVLSGIQHLNESIGSLGGYHGAHDDLEGEDVSYVSIQNDLDNRWFSRYVIAAMLVDENKRFLISSFCLYIVALLSVSLEIGCKPPILQAVDWLL